MGPRHVRSSVLTHQDEEAIVVASREHTLLPLDDCLYALQATIPHLTRSSVRRDAINNCPASPLLVHLVSGFTKPLSTRSRQITQDH